MSDNHRTTEMASKLLACVHEFRQQKELREIATFKRLRAEWAKWRELRINKERSSAPRHNIIRLLGLERSEVGLHSPFLCDLLDPDGTHGQGGLLLRAFLKLLDQKLKDNRHRLADKEFHAQVPDVPDSGDWNVLSEHEKIDIRIYSPKAGLLVFIENKIDAPEQHMQIARYRQLLNRQKAAYPNALLVGLSPRSYTFRTGDPDVHLTYEEDILGWLTEAEQQISPSAMKLRSNICQYREIVRNSSGEEQMPSQELIDLISKPENIHCAWDIADAIKEVENSLRRKFWKAVSERLQAALAGAAHATDWVIAGLKEISDEPNKQSAGVYLAPAVRNSANLRVGVWQESKRVFQGVGFSAKQSDPHLLRGEIDALRNALPDEWQQHPMDSFWVGWSWTALYPDSRDFMLSALADPETLAQPATETVVSVLSNQSLWYRIIEVNNALSR